MWLYGEVLQSLPVPTRKILIDLPLKPPQEGTELFTINTLKKDNTEVGGYKHHFLITIFGSGAYIPKIIFKVAKI